jgi:hypothetical protein
MLQINGANMGFIQEDFRITLVYLMNVSQRLAFYTVVSKYR